MNGTGSAITHEAHAGGHSHGSVACCGGSTNDSPLLRGVLTGVCAASALIAYAIDSTNTHPTALSLYVLSYLTGGWIPVREVAASLFQRNIDVNLLMVLAAIGAAFIGSWGEGAALLFLFSLSGALEKYTLERTARSIEGLIELRPDSAVVIRGGVEQRVPIDSIAVGEHVRVMPGERVGVDGTVVDGSTTMDQSTITGESMPVGKNKGDQVFAGTLNQHGSVVVEVQRASGETTLSSIVRTVRAAQEAKASTEKFIQKWQKPYVIAVLGASVTMALFRYFFPDPNAVTGSITATPFYHAMVLLVAASPCAVVIATPAATLAGITRAARSGVLFKGGAYLEKLAGVSVVAFDKTGTLTEGKPSVGAVWSEQSQGPGSGVQSSGKYNDAQLRLLQLAASVEQRSEHPLARAVVDEARALGIQLLDVQEFESHTAAGVHALFDGAWIGVGRRELFQSHGLRMSDELLTQAARIYESGQTALIVMTNKGEYGVIGVADSVRPEAAAIIETLRRLGVQRTVVLTGDNVKVAESISRAVKADQVHAGLLPEQKVTEIAKLKRSVGPVAMVGDGINDAPALAAADIGIAMGGGGTDVALQTADVVLMKNDLRGIATAVWLSRRTRAAITRGLIFAFLVIAVLVAGTLFNLPLWLAVVCHEGSTVCTIFSGLALLVERPPADIR